MENEKKVIKLSEEQIEEKEIQKIKTQMNLELTELSIKHMNMAIEKNLPLRETQLQLNQLKKNLETYKHNIAALQEQIDKGEM